MAVAILIFISTLSVQSQLDHKLVWSTIHNRNILRALHTKLRKIPLTLQRVTCMLKPIKSGSLTSLYVSEVWDSFRILADMSRSGTVLVQ